MKEEPPGVAAEIMLEIEAVGENANLGLRLVLEGELGPGCRYQGIAGRLHGHSRLAGVLRSEIGPHDEVRRLDLAPGAARGAADDHREQQSADDSHATEDTQTSTRVRPIRLTVRRTAAAPPWMPERAESSSVQRFLARVVDHFDARRDDGRRETE